MKRIIGITTLLIIVASSLAVTVEIANILNYYNYLLPK